MPQSGDISRCFEVPGPCGSRAYVIKLILAILNAFGDHRFGDELRTELGPFRIDNPEWSFDVFGLGIDDKIAFNEVSDSRHDFFYNSSPYQNQTVKLYLSPNL